MRETVARKPRQTRHRRPRQPRRRAILILVAALGLAAILGRLAGRDAPEPPRDTAAACARGTLAGEVTHVRYGTTIEVAGVPIRLHGLAAPGRHQPLGDEATVALREMVAGRELRCELDGTRTRDRCVGICYLNGTDISAELVRMGLARDCPRFSGGRYREEELAAAEAGATIREAYELPGYCVRRSVTGARAFSSQPSKSTGSPVTVIGSR